MGLGEAAEDGGGDAAGGIGGGDEVVEVGGGEGDAVGGEEGVKDGVVGAGMLVVRRGGQGAQGVELVGGDDGMAGRVEQADRNGRRSSSRRRRGGTKRARDGGGVEGCPPRRVMFPLLTGRGWRWRGAAGPGWRRRRG